MSASKIIVPFMKEGGEALQLKLENRLWVDAGPEVSTELYLDEIGLHVRFDVRESDPLITAKEQGDGMPMVCQDSAVEVFLAFADSFEQKDAFKPKLDHCLYTNIEINAAGVCYAKYGRSRKNRTACSKEQIASFNIKCAISEDHWTCDLTVPREYVTAIAGFDAFAPGGVFFMNLYKISETKEFEHYVSFNPVVSDRPNFHLPEHFATFVAE